MKGLRVAASFLTRVPLGGRARGAGDIARGVPWFPVVGCGVGVVMAGVYGAARSVLPSFVAAALAVSFAVWTTGAFHEDGLADTADAFGGLRSRDETMRILKDPRLGTYGVAALSLSLLVRIGALASLEARSAFAVLPAAHALSRAGAVALLRGPAASEEGLGASYAHAVTNAQITGAVAAGMAIGVAALGPVAVLAAAGVGLVCWLVARIAYRRIGGVTGDVLGASQQMGEVIVLLVGVAATGQGWLDVPWWDAIG